MSSEQHKLLKDPDCFYTDNGNEPSQSFHFEFSSPISSIGSSCSSPVSDCEQSNQVFPDDTEENASADYVSIEDLQSQISPPSDDKRGGIADTSNNKTTVLETIFEDCYLETPPGSPRTPRSKRTRPFRINLSNFEEFKESIQNSDKQPAFEDK